jgi:hypothetical protein
MTNLRIVRPGDVAPSAQPTLVGRTHDRPVAWDGKPITWRPWEVALDVRMCSRQPCRCGRENAQWTCTGLIDGWVALYMERCWCGRDIVVEAKRGGGAWLLDESDYADDGSWSR